MKALKSFLLFIFFIGGFAKASSLSEIPLELINKKSSSKSVVFEIESPDSSELASRLASRGVKATISPKSIRFELSRYPTLSEKVPPYTLESSFLINFNKEAFQKLINLSQNPYELRDFVYAHIENKNYSKGVELAHQSLESKSGDCTEHAILLTALLRIQKIPSKVVLGIVVIEGLEKAYMHAWTEYMNEKTGRFELLDATKMGASDHHYIPLHALQTESAAYAKDFLRALNLRLEKVRVL